MHRQYTLRQLQTRLTTGPFGTVLSASEYMDGGVPLVNPTHIVAGKIVAEDHATVGPETAARLRRHRLNSGDLVIGRKGDVGRSALVTEKEVGWICGSDSIAVRTNADVLDPRFLQWVMSSRLTRDLLASRSSGAAVDGINEKVLLDLPVPAPPIKVQRTTSDYLDAETARIDALLEARRRQSKLLADRRRAVIDGFTVPETLGGPADSETSWPIAKIKRAAKFFADGDWIESPFITSDGIRLIQTGNIGEGIYRDQGFRFITDETFKSLGCTEVLPGDILISRLAGTVGRSCLAPDLGTRMVVSVDVVIMRPVAELDPAFAVAYLSSSFHIALAELLARGTTMSRLSRSQVGALPIPLPPLSVQRRVVGEIERHLVGLNALAAALDLQVARLLERRQAIITAAVTGQLDIPGVAP